MRAFMHAHAAPDFSYRLANTAGYGRESLLDPDQSFLSSLEQHGDERGLGLVVPVA